jgi:hypothetical protein
MYQGSTAARSIRLTESVVGLYVGRVRAVPPSADLFRREMNWKIALALSGPVIAIGSLTTWGCTDTECTRADDQIQTCAQQELLNAPSNTMPDNQVCDPGTARFCQSVCINGASCSTINATFCYGQIACPETPDAGALDDGGPTSVSTFVTCLMNCLDGGT